MNKVRVNITNAVINAPTYAGVTFSPSMINFKENFVSQYMVVKALDCYLYQCYGTDDVEGAPILDYLDDLERSLALYIVKRNKYFDLLMWG